MLSTLFIVALIAALSAGAYVYRSKIARLEADRDALGEALAESFTEQALLEDLLTAALRQNTQGAK